MRNALVALALTAVAIIALVTIADHGKMVGPDQSTLRPIWTAAGEVTFSDRSCGNCHYGSWQAWNASYGQDANGWFFSVQPALREVQLFAPQVGLASEMVVWESERMTHDWAQGLWQVSFDVPENATGIFARAHTEYVPLNLIMANVFHGDRIDYNTTLSLVAPDGRRFVADGPESDLHVLALAGPDVQPGTWTFEANSEETVTVGALQGVAWIEVLGGDVRAQTLRYGQAATFRVDAGPDGLPRPLDLRVRPYRDHSLNEVSDWDRNDTSPFVARFSSTMTPPASAPAPGGDAFETIVLERTEMFAYSYEDREGHKFDEGTGSSSPHYGSAIDPVPPGTQKVRFELSWIPPIEKPELSVKFSPNGTFFYFIPEEIDRSPGFASFEAQVSPENWDSGSKGSWDVAPFIQSNIGESMRGAFRLDLRVVAVAS